MKFFNISSLATIALLTVAGCAASTDEASQASQDDEVIAGTEIELTSTRDPASVQAKLFKLMTTFKNDASLDISSAIHTNTRSDERHGRGRYPWPRDHVQQLSDGAGQPRW